MIEEPTIETIEEEPETFEIDDNFLSELNSSNYQKEQELEQNKELNSKLEKEAEKESEKERKKQEKQNNFWRLKVDIYLNYETADLGRHLQRRIC